MDETESRLKQLVRFHCKAAKWPSPVSGLTLFRSDVPSAPVRSLYDPRICIVLQGRKQIRIEKRVIDIGPGDCLAVVLDLPVSAGVVEATPIEPHLSLTIDLDLAALRTLIRDDIATTVETVYTGAATTILTADLLEPVERLVRLLDRPQDIPALAPLLKQEILYRLLQGRLGPMLRQCAESGSRLGRIATVTAWITQNFDKPFDIAQLADMAAMSVTTFHRNFKAATDMTPVQFRTRLRLHEARRRIHLGEAHLGRIAFDIGYRSQSQFNREYQRLFGQAPGQTPG